MNPLRIISTSEGIRIVSERTKHTYRFFVDFWHEGSREDLARALADLLLSTRSLCLLGQYEPALERIRQGIDPAKRAKEALENE